MFGKLARLTLQLVHNPLSDCEAFCVFFIFRLKKDYRTISRRVIELSPGRQVR